MQKIVNQNPATRLIGIIPIVFGVAFIYFIQTNFSDEFFSTMRPFMILVPSVMILFGIFFLFSKTELIYDDETIEKRTKFFGFTWSHKVDRALVRDIGPEAAGLISRKTPRNHFSHDIHDHH